MSGRHVPISDPSLPGSASRSPNVVIEPCTGADQDAIARIWFESWRSAGVAVAEEVTQDELRARLTGEIGRGWLVFVARREGRTVGFMALDGAWVSQLFVAPDAQSQGVGKALLDLAKLLLPDGFHLDTAAESRAVRFYEREGLARGETSTHPRFGHPIVRYDWQPD